MKHVIVGNGPAGMAAAYAIRAARPEDRVTVVTADEGIYYSKVREPDLVAGTVEARALELAGVDVLRSAGIDVVAETPVVSLDVHARRLFLSDGREIPYDRLLLATGASPLVPPVPGLAGGIPRGVFTLRTLRDARRLGEAATAAREAVVVGGGFIGVHVAWALAARGLRVTLVEKMPTLLPGSCDEAASALVAAHLGSRGVRVMLGCALEAVSGDGGPGGLRVVVAGNSVPCDLLVLAVGVKPNTELARQAGAEVAQGVVTDATMATTAPGVWAAGDAAQAPDLATGKPAVIPLWPLAVAQGRVAGRNMAGLRASYRGGLRVNPVHLGSLQLISIGEIFPVGPSARVLTGPVSGRLVPRAGDRAGGRPLYVRVAFQDDRPVGVLLVGRVEAAGVLGSLIARALRWRGHDDVLRMVASVLRSALPARP